MKSADNVVKLKFPDRDQLIGERLTLTDGSVRYYLTLVSDGGGCVVWDGPSELDMRAAAAEWVGSGVIIRLEGVR